ncbi:MAG: heterodisulfide reductase [Deltaproteobacteria bacterium]|nr:MAG: heterodisulfide reductase [Deltaproteobacteria bacterium]
MRIDRSFIEEVSERSGQRFDRCFHCMACSGGCPVSGAMDYLPNQIVRMMQLGLRQQVLESKAIWICIGCYSCLTECPNRIHIPHMMDALREMALEEKVEIAEPEIWAFHREFLRQVKKRGRIFELEFMGRYKMATGQYFNDFIPGLKMLRLGRMELLPDRVKKLEEIRRIREACGGSKK